MHPSEDDFPSTTETQELVAVIKQRIAAEGPITFREFMTLALYHPQHGYYCSTREKMGRHARRLAQETHNLSTVRANLWSTLISAARPTPGAGEK